MRLVLVFLALVTFSFALGSTVMTVMVAEAPSQGAPSASSFSGSHDSLNGYVTIRVEAPAGAVNDSVSDP